MEIREATAADGDAIRSVATASMEASYSLSPATIEGAVANWYDEERLTEKLDDREFTLLVAEADGEVQGFSESLTVDEQGDILWLHVDPAHRGTGVGVELYEATREALLASGADIVRGMVLADNVEGNDFYEHRGLVKAGEGEVDIDGEAHVENIYVAEEPDELEALTIDGETYYLDYTDADRGSEAPFLTVYEDADRKNRYGLYCSNCESLVTAMDSMGRLECGECGNRRRPTRWDAAYL